MKQQFIFLALLAFATLTSCKKKYGLVDAIGTPAEMIVGTWSVGYVIEKDIDATGKVLNSKTTSTNTGVTGIRANGTYFTLTSSTGKWELSTDGTKITYDKGASDERFYKILKLNYATWIAEGPYKTTDSKPYFSGKLYEYENLK